VKSIVKDSHNEIPVPLVWRDALKQVADNLTLGLPIEQKEGVRCVPMENDSKSISLANIEQYPEELGILSDVTWKSSVCLWHETYWGITVDLYTVGGEPSDLILDARVYEDGQMYRIEPYLVYVP